MSDIGGSSRMVDDGRLTGKPYFHVTLTKSALYPKYPLVVPREGSSILPTRNVRKTTLSKGGETWEVKYYGVGVQKRFDIPGWTKFATDNSLSIGDTCIFEVMDIFGSTMLLKVTILSGEFPPELEAMGRSSDSPIAID